MSTFPTEMATLSSKFVAIQREFETYRNGRKPVKVDGQTLSIAAVTAAARCNTPVTLDQSSHIKSRVAQSRSVIAEKVESGISVYGLSTGFGGSADTRTDQPLLLGKALLQHQQAGILPSSTTKPQEMLPLMDVGSSLSMPESWVRGAMLVRANSLIRGHSGVRWELIEKITELLRANITPLVPLRGSISASGDLSPLSYIAGALVGNPSIRVFDGPKTFGMRSVRPSREALDEHKIEPLTLASKEPLGILNGTAFSASVAALSLNDAIHLVMLSQVCTAMGVEALNGTRASFDAFIHSSRPHPGQIEAAQNIWKLLQGSKFAQDHEGETSIEEDKHTLRQDRYPLRTSPQFLGPQIEDLLHATAAVTQECNSTTDNPLIDSSTGIIHHGGNFQAMAITNAMEHTRLALQHVGKLLFAQMTELVNPAMNNGLPPSLAASDPSLNYHCKGADIAAAAYCSELGYLANPVSTHVQSAEMHNQAVNSLALISGRATVNSVQVLSLLTASYLYRRLSLKNYLVYSAPAYLNQKRFRIASSIFRSMSSTFDKTTIMDCTDQMNAIAASGASVLIDRFISIGSADSLALGNIVQFRSKISSRAATLLRGLRKSYLTGERGDAPAVVYLGKTQAVYKFIRVALGIKMHGTENLNGFTKGPGESDTIGQSISVINEAICDGRMQNVVADLFESLDRLFRPIQNRNS
ncbi:phenylalanine ammonia-lyase [Gymnopus androsaceus JB14]|uniref:Phenylalanine ammonia-lyase n=1 Tax=Gymnopus androsaceus JB14 TaxID=1447944 RepID=A0A6A4ILW6_9AGAR|nr:phenylalanine ammonia-lyase [Gymnopus androsaceus JB14]